MNDSPLHARNLQRWKLFFCKKVKKWIYQVDIEAADLSGLLKTPQVCTESIEPIYAIILGLLAKRLQI